MVLGINSDEDVARAKGPPLMTCKERARLIAHCKWVDDVREDTPYDVTVATLDRLNCD